MIWHKRYIRPTALEDVRMKAARKAGCILSAYRRERGLEAPKPGLTHLHHLKDGNKQMGHGFTICLSAWYHERVVPYPCESIEEARARYGASLKDGSKAFLASHGITERGLWELQQKRLGQSTEWPASKIMPRRLPKPEVGNGEREGRASPETTRDLLTEAERVAFQSTTENT